MSTDPKGPERPDGATLAEVARHAADICRHVAAYLAGESGMTDRAARRRLLTCARDIVELLDGEASP